MFEGIIKIIRDHDLFDTAFPKPVVSLGIVLATAAIALFLEGFIAEWSFFLSDASLYGAYWLRVDRSLLERVYLGSRFAFDFLLGADRSQLGFGWIGWPLAAYSAIRVLGLATKLLDEIAKHMADEIRAFQHAGISSNQKRPLQHAKELGGLREKIRHYIPIVGKIKWAILSVTMLFILTSILILSSHLLGIPFEKTDEAARLEPAAATGNFGGSAEWLRLMVLVCLLLAWTVARYSRAWAPIQWAFLVSGLILGFLQAVYAGQIEGEKHLRFWTVEIAWSDGVARDERYVLLSDHNSKYQLVNLRGDEFLELPASSVMSVRFIDQISIGQIIHRQPDSG